MDSSVQNAGDIAMMPTGIAHLSKLGPSGNIDKAAKDFEGMFMGQMLAPMFEGMEVDKTFGGGNGEKIMRSMLVQEYGKLAAKSAHFGIADAVKAEMIRAQNGATRSSPAANSNNGGQNATTQ